MKKLVKLDHRDPQINRIQRNVEDVFTSVQQDLSGNVLLQSTLNQSISSSISVNGKLAVGYGSAPSGTVDTLQVNGIASAGAIRCRAGLSGASGTNTYSLSWDGNKSFLWIDTQNIGIISTTSDRRLKKNVSPMTSSAMALISQLNPVSFRWVNQTTGIWRDDGVDHHGFIADELQSVFPGAVDGAPNAVQPDGSPRYQNINLSELAAYQIRAFQELFSSGTDQQAQMQGLSASNTALQGTVSQQSQSMAALQASLVQQSQSLASLSASYQSLQQVVALQGAAIAAILDPKKK